MADSWFTKMSALSSFCSSIKVSLSSGAVTSAGDSAPAINHKTGTFKIPESSMSLFARGLVRLDSQLATVLFLMPIRSANWAWVKPLASRALIIRVLRKRAEVSGSVSGMESRWVVSESLPYVVNPLKSKSYPCTSETAKIAAPLFTLIAKL